MKYYLLPLVTLFLVFSLSTSAQTLEMSRAEVSYEGKSRPSIKVSLQPESKEVKKAWKKFIQNSYDADVDGFGLFSNKEILKAEAAEISSISNKKMDLFAQIVESGDQTEMQVFGAVGYDLFFGPQNYAQEFWAMEDLVIDFLVSFLPDQIQDNVDEAAETLSDLKDERADMEKDIEDKMEKIDDLKKEIVETENEIVQLKKDLITNGTSINKAEIEVRIKKRKLERVEDKLKRMENIK